MFLFFSSAAAATAIASVLSSNQAPTLNAAMLAGASPSSSVTGPSLDSEDSAHGLWLGTETVRDSPCRDPSPHACTYKFPLDLGMSRSIFSALLAILFSLP